jgi:predicted nuclease with TOPRIM domain
MSSMYTKTRVSEIDEEIRELEGDLRQLRQTRKSLLDNYHNLRIRVRRCAARKDIEDKL